MSYATAKRLFDIVSALIGLVLMAPVLGLAAIGIAISSPGPIFYRAHRAGLNGTPFVMYKLRTMHWRAVSGAAITGAKDSRVFRFGALLRRLKLDEVPQLLNVLKGEMSIVGPRAEDPTIVHAHYTTRQWETLAVVPGLASPGSLFNYTHWDQNLSSDDPGLAYVRDLLPAKLALELVYVRHRSFAYDLRLIWRTVRTIAQIASGRREFADPPEMGDALRLLATEARFQSSDAVARV